MDNGNSVRFFLFLGGFVLARETANRMGAGIGREGERVGWRVWGGLGTWRGVG